MTIHPKCVNKHMTFSSSRLASPNTQQKRAHFSMHISYMITYGDARSIRVESKMHKVGCAMINI